MFGISGNVIQYDKVCQKLISRGYLSLDPSAKDSYNVKNCTIRMQMKEMHYFYEEIPETQPGSRMKLEKSLHCECGSNAEQIHAVHDNY